MVSGFVRLFALYCLYSVIMKHALIHSVSVFNFCFIKILMVPVKINFLSFRS